MVSFCIPSISAGNHENSIGSHDQSVKHSRAMACAGPIAISVACRPAYNASAEQIDDDGEIEPTFVGPDVGDIACLFLIDGFGLEITVENI